jgi:hypothetical protein
MSPGGSMSRFTGNVQEARMHRRRDGELGQTGFVAPTVSFAAASRPLLEYAWRLLDQPPEF